MHKAGRDTISFLHVVCYKWGNRYTCEDVNILFAMVRRHLTVDHRFHCLTDNPDGLTGDMVVHPLPATASNSTMRKLRTFSPDFLGLRGQFVVSLDVDLVIVDNVDFLAAEPESDFLIAPDFCSSNRVHSAVYRLKVGAMPRIWEDYIRDPEKAENSNPSRIDREQQWIETHVGKPDFFPRGKIVSFKYNCQSRSFRIFGPYGAQIGLTTSHFGSAKVPPGAAIVSFHGDILPRNVRNGRYMEWRRANFVSDHWHIR